MSRNFRFGDSVKFRQDLKDENNINSENTTTYLKQTVEISNAPTSLAFGTPELDMFKDSRMREKSEMTNLNSRLANYIEISREKSNLNIELMDELEYVKNQIRNETGAIKELYEAELGQLRNVLDDMEHDKNEFILVADNNQRMCDDLEERINNFKNSEENNILKIKELDNKLSNLDFKINNLSSKNDFLKDEKNRDSEIIKNLRLDLEIAQNELNEETILRSDSQNRCQSIAEEIQFNKDIHERELKDLLAVANYDPLNQSKDWWNWEFSSCIKEIQEEYNNRLDEVKSEMESQYNMKICEIETYSMQNSQLTSSSDQLKTLKTSNSVLENETLETIDRNSMLISQNEKLRNEIKLLEDQYNNLSMEKMNEIDEIRKHQAAALAELRTIIDDNLSLQMEIVSYQKLLEYEEARIGISHLNNGNVSKFNKVVEPVVQKIRPKPKLERKYTYKRSSKGPIAISDTISDGSCVTIINMDKNFVQNLEDWRIVQKVDGTEINEFIFGRYYLGPGNIVNIWAMGFGTRNSNDLEWQNETCLGIGDQVVTILFNSKGKEKSTYTQKALFKV